MTFHRILICLLIATLAVPSAFAKQRYEPPEVWRAFAEKLDAGVLVKVTLKDRSKVKGRFVMIEGDNFRVKPQTRIPVPIRDFRFSDIASIDRQNEGWTPGAKVLTGVATAIGVVFLIGLALAASLD
jgi:hypothetical protein